MEKELETIVNYYAGMGAELGESFIEYLKQCDERRNAILAQIEKENKEIVELICREHNEDKVVAEIFLNYFRNKKYGTEKILTGIKTVYAKMAKEGVV